MLDQAGGDKVGSLALPLISEDILISGPHYEKFRGNHVCVFCVFLHIYLL